MTNNQIMTRIAKDRKEKWKKQIKCYYEECLTCQRACKITNCRGETAFNLTTCTKPHGEPVQWPYLMGLTGKELEEAVKEIKRDEQRKRK